MPLTSAERRKLKGVAQRLNATLKIGAQGVSDAVVAELVTELTTHPLVKARFEAHKDERHELAETLADRANCDLVTVVGHVAVFSRRAAASTSED